MKARWLRFVLLVAKASAWGLLSLAALAGCTVMVQATNPPQSTPSYYLHGRNAAALRSEADKLCPNGYVVTREWQHYEGADRSGFVLKRWFAQAVDWIGPPAFDEAQLDVQCKPASAPATSTSAPAPSAPSSAVPQT
jgi:hypothetical protein